MVVLKFDWIEYYMSQISHIPIFQECIVYYLFSLVSQRINWEYPSWSTCSMEVKSWVRLWKYSVFIRSPSPLLHCHLLFGSWNYSCTAIVSSFPKNWASMIESNNDTANKIYLQSFYSFLNLKLCSLHFNAFFLIIDLFELWFFL